MENVFFLKVTSTEYVHDYILKLTFNNGNLTSMFHDNKALQSTFTTWPALMTWEK